eukprot:scaffold177943_cov84-Cyclotella_meneghiniana.AAC.1
MSNGVQGNIHHSSERTDSNATRSQSRAGRFRSDGGRYLQQVKSRLRAFKRGTSQRDRRIHPSPTELDSRSNRQFSQMTVDAPFDPNVTAAMASEQVVVDRLVEEMHDGGYGFVEGRKPSDIIRLMGENVNNLSLYDETRAWKIPKIKEINKRYQTDGLLLQECGTDFHQTSAEQALDVLLGDSDCRFVTANNVTEASARTQHGGVAALNFPRLAGFTLETGKDSTGLGRWAYTYVGTSTRKTRIITAYRPVKPSRSQIKGRQRVRQLLLWKNAGDEIILFMDVNDHVYRGRLPWRFAERDLMMTERFLATNGFEAPNSYYRGSKPITGCFCTQGIDCVNVYASPHRAGAGDHRYWIMDFDAKSVLGAGYPHLVRPKGRRLKCVVKRTRVAYLRRLRKLTERHRMYSKMQLLHKNADTVSPRQMSIAMNKWDRENAEHKLSSEEHCMRRA